VLGVGLTVRFDLIELSYSDNLSTPASWFWIFALGWAIGKATALWQRLLVTAAVAGTVVGHSDDAQRVVLVTGGMLLLIWVPRLPATTLLQRYAGILAGGSLYIYLTHWHVYPHLAPRSGLLALVASLLVGVLYGVAIERLRPIRRYADRLGSLNPRKEKTGDPFPVRSHPRGVPRRRAARRHRSVQRRRLLRHAGRVG
jgi:hypothetical protein